MLEVVIGEMQKGGPGVNEDLLGVIIKEDISLFNKNFFKRNCPVILIDNWCERKVPIHHVILIVSSDDQFGEWNVIFITQP